MDVDDGFALDPCSEDDLNNDVNSLYVEIIEKNQTYFKCKICGRNLSRKQRLETLTGVMFTAKVRNNRRHANHNFECADYKRVLPSSL